MRWSMTSLTVKIIAAACMALAGIGMRIPGAPAWLEWFAYPSLILFMFMVGWSCEYTRNRGDYLVRLYMSGVVAAIIQTIFRVEPNPFPLLLQIAILIVILRNGDRMKRVRYIALYVLWQTVWFVMLNQIFPFRELPWLADYRHMIVAFFALMPTWDYRLGMVVVGVLMWRFRRSPRKLGITVLAAVVVWIAMMNTRIGLWVLYLPYHLDALGPGAIGLGAVDPGSTAWAIALQYIGFDPYAMGAPLFAQPLWLIAAALPVMLLYNRRRGFPNPDSVSRKWFFYFLYPAGLIACAG